MLENEVRYFLWNGSHLGVDCSIEQTQYIDSINRDKYAAPVKSRASGRLRVEASREFIEDENSRGKVQRAVATNSAGAKRQAHIGQAEGNTFQYPGPSDRRVTVLVRVRGLWGGWHRGPEPRLEQCHFSGAISSRVLADPRESAVARRPAGRDGRVPRCRCGGQITCRTGGRVRYYLLRSALCERD